jgi:large repetitive protein
VLTSADIGHTLNIVVTASNSAGTSSATSVATSVIAGIAPTNTSLPVVSGTTTDGQTLSTTTGVWSGSPTITYSYQWRVCDSSGNSCTNILAATASTYTLISADVGKTVDVVVTATNSAGSSSAISAASAIISGVAPANTTLPVISGNTNDGQTLSATNGAFSGSTPLTYTYQWQRCDSTGASCANISGAISNTYLLSSADVGSTLDVIVTATNSTGATSATSTHTAVIGGITPVNTVLPAISGTPVDGQTLTTTNGTWSGSTPITYAYQWQRCDNTGNSCSAISGATTNSYTLTSADVGSTLDVIVTATNSAGSTAATSATVSTVGGIAPTDNTVPVVSGTTTNSQTLASDHGTWSGSTPITYSYQWQSCNSSGAACSNILGATSDTYTLTSADVGHTLVVVVTATNVAGTASATSSASSVIAGVAPANTSLPDISGTPVDGQTLSVTTGVWSGSTPITYSYQWQRCNSAGTSCVNISGATTNTYTLVSGDVGGTIDVIVTATNSAGSSSATALIGTGNIIITEPIAPGVLSVSAPSAVTATPVTLSNAGNQLSTYSIDLASDDATGSGDGWNETISQTPFTDSHGNTLGESDVLSVATTDAPGSTNTEPVDNPSSVSFPFALSTSPSIFKVSDTGSGMGDFIVTPSMSVQVPANAKAGTYTAVASVNIVSGP